MPAFRRILFPAAMVALLTSAAMGTSLPIQFNPENTDKDLQKRIEQIVRRAGKDTLSADVTGLLWDEGYLGGKVGLSGDTVVVDAGPLYEMGDIYLTVITPDGEIVRDTLRRYRGYASGKGAVDGLKEDILTPYRDQGYYFASINVDRIDLDEATIRFHLKLIAGPMVRIERLRFYGLRRTNPGFVERLSGLRPGDPFVESRLQTGLRSIEAAGFLQNDSVPQVIPNENYDRAGLLFYLREIKSNVIELGGGYLPGQGDIEGEFVGRLRFRSLNLFGSGRRLDLLLDRKDRASSEIDLRFGQPFFIPDHMELVLHARQVDYDSSYHSFTFDGGLSLYTGGGTQLTGGGSWTKTEPQRSSQPPSRLLTGDIRFLTQSFDFVPNPSRGRKFAFGISYIRRISWPDTSISAVINNESMFEIAAENYVRIGRRLVWRLNIESKVRITSRELIDYSEQFKLGGFSSLRGYRQDQFAGRRTVMAQSEFRLRPSPAFAVYVFADMGYIYAKKEIQPGEVVSEEPTRLGSGFGLFVGGENARMILELGWGRHDRLDDGKIHLGLTTLF